MTTFDSVEHLTNSELSKELAFGEAAMVEGDPLTEGWLNHLRAERDRREAISS